MPQRGGNGARPNGQHKAATGKPSSREIRDEESSGGPARWLMPFLERRFTKLREHPAYAPGEREATEAEIESRERAAIAELTTAPQRAQAAAPGEEFRSLLQPGRGADVLASLPSGHWRDVMLQYRERQREARERAHPSVRRVEFLGPQPSAPGVPGSLNWKTVGPSVVRRGQPSGRPAISGRADRIAIAPGGTRLYVATADGGVWRSDNSGASWYSTMENFDVDPTAFAATSLACGAVAIDPAHPDRVYIGTGEGDTNALFSSRVTGALPSYRGVGPLRSDDGGATWHSEATAAGSPSLVDGAFYDLAVDPGDRENVVAATNVGLYRREPDGAGGYYWVQKRTGIHSSVVVARTGSTTTFFAAAWGDRVYSSPDGSTWTAVGTGFPAGPTRIGLAVQVDNPNVVYALVANSSNALLGIYRLDNMAGAWQNITGAPAGVLGHQGNYDLTITVDPNNANVIFIGGSAVAVSDAAIYRCTISTTGGGPPYSMAPTWVGSGAHPDVHQVIYAPGDSNTLWTCTDGGVFATLNASTGANFSARNVGLSTLSANFLSQHPTQPAVMLCGFQDNGTGRFVGEECWTHVMGGDGGYPVINWNDPFRVLAYADGSVSRATDGALDYSSWTDVTPPGATWQIMAEPLVTTPINPASPSDAEVVAFGAGTSLFLSTNFGTSWSTLTAVAGGLIFGLAFASANRLFVATTGGRVYRYDRSGTTWTQTRIDNVAAGALPLTGIITCVAIDLADATGSSVYITFGGSGDYRHVWHFDGTRWQARSGPSAGAVTSLLDVETNVVVVDPAHTTTLYVGADIGVWKSTDAGMSWSLLEAGLPDAAVMDLQIHAASRRLRAALHGRGVYDYQLDTPVPPDVELYIRDTPLDLGLSTTVDGLPDPSRAPAPGSVVLHYESVNIKVDVPTPAGYQTPTPNIDFYQFNDVIVDGSGGVGTLDPSSGTVTNRVYVEVHNGGIQIAPGVQVMLLLANASAGLPPLPAGYTSSVQTGTPISTVDWQTVGVRTLSNLRLGYPQIAEFNLPSTLLPPPASLPGQSHYCLLALLHSAADPFTSTQTNTDTLTLQDRKVGQKNIHVVQFVGTPPPAGGPSVWTELFLAGDEHQLARKLVLDLREFGGRISLLAPDGVFDPAGLRNVKTDNPTAVSDWASLHLKLLDQFKSAGRFNFKSCARMQTDIQKVIGRPLYLLQAKGQISLPLMPMRPGMSRYAFLRIQLPPQTKIGDAGAFGVSVQPVDGGGVLGGSTYRVSVIPAPTREPARRTAREKVGAPADG